MRIRKVGPSNRRAHAGASKIPAFDTLNVESGMYLVLGDVSRVGCGGGLPCIAHSPGAHADFLSSAHSQSPFSTVASRGPEERRWSIRFFTWIYNTIIFLSYKRPAPSFNQSLLQSSRRFGGLTLNRNLFISRGRKATYIKWGADSPGSSFRETRPPVTNPASETKGAVARHDKYSRKVT